MPCARERRPLLPAIAINADSLATWFVPALAMLREQHEVCPLTCTGRPDHSSELLRQGQRAGGGERRS